MDKHTKRAQYMYENKLTYEEAAEHFNVKKHAIRESIEMAGDDWKYQINLMLRLKKINKNKNKYNEMAKYMLESKLSYEEMAQHYNTVKGVIRFRIGASDNDLKYKIKQMLKKK